MRSSQESLDISTDEHDSDDAVIERAIAQPISKPAQAPWDVTISHEDLQKFLEGSRPMDMDDKWLCETYGPNSEGEYLVHFTRSWTSFTVIAIRVQAELNEDGEPLPDKPVRVHEILWETDPEKYNSDETSESMKEMARNLAYMLVQVKLPGSD
ncbi:unnamed protein product [Clonostachys byssicola]|uniref:Uncharacterized protein n=1 Tax=Clonostachys byssicola TaxID=160290 RepID=A0A9N9Y2R8_9HYPO|nr:unnamed protein product [Clonostachys byssicola]